jgi:Beta-propeller repeat
MVSGRGAGAVLARARAPIILTILVLGGAFLLQRDDIGPNPHRSGARVNPTEIRAAFGRLPVSFEQNQGQSDGRVKFLARGNGYGLYLTANVAALVFGGQSGKAEVSGVEMRFAGANPTAHVAGSDRLPGHSNYFIGNDPSRWLHNVPQFGRVVYREIYPGIDLAFYGKQGRLEYDFDVAPGADPSQIQLDLSGADRLQIAENGDLVLTKNERELRFQAPHVYQNSSTGPQNVSGAFVLAGHNRVSFQVGDYDRTRTLVIDPVLVFSSYLGGSGNESCTAATSPSGGFVPHCPAITVDSAGQIYVAGTTTSTGTFAGLTPQTPATAAGSANVFVSQISLSSTGSTLDFVTYLGGGTGTTQYPVGIGVDSGFNIYVGGTTDAPDYPVTATAFQSPPVSSANHAFVSELDSTGSALLYSTYLAGSGADVVAGMTVDSLAKVYLFGTTTSSDLPTTPGAIQPASKTTNQFFFGKIDPAASGSSGLQYLSYFGGATPSSGNVAGGAIAVDSKFNVYIAGGTDFVDMPIVNGYTGTKQTGESIRCGFDVWAAQLKPPANNTQQYTPNYETYFGDPGATGTSCPSGSGDDIAYGIASDGTSTYITGSTTSTNITVPSTTASFQSTSGGGTDTFVAKFGAPTGTGTAQGTTPLNYFSYIGGSAQDVGLAVVSDSLGNARVTGLTKSSNFPATVNNPLQGSFQGGTDAFVARLNTTGTTTSNGSSTVSFLGGSAVDIGTSIVLDASLNVYVTGETSSGNFPTANALPTTGGNLSGGPDVFVSVIGPNTGGLSMPQVTPAGSTSPPGPGVQNPTASPSPVGVGSQVTFTYYIYNTGDPVPGVIFTDTLGINSGSTTASATGGTLNSCGSAVTSGQLTCTLGTVNTSTITTTTSGGTTTTTIAPAAHVAVVVTAPTNVLSGSFSLGNSAVLTSAGGTTSPIQANATVNDFTVSIVQPSAATVIAGGVATFKAQVTPTGAGFPGSVSLSCASGLPAGASCSFTNNPIPNMSNGPQSRTFEITTTARVTTPASLFHGGPTYALWMPILGVGLLGAGISRKRRLLLGAFFVTVMGIALLQAGCGSSNDNSTTTTGTPAGTYTVVVNATGGTTRSTTLQLTVQ